MSKKDQRKGDENHGLEVIGNISLQIKVPYAWDFCIQISCNGHWAQYERHKLVFEKLNNRFQRNLKEKLFLNALC